MVLLLCGEFKEIPTFLWNMKGTVAVVYVWATTDQDRLPSSLNLNLYFVLTLYTLSVD
jgi:hypothetical protein